MSPQREGKEGGTSNSVAPSPISSGSFTHPPRRKSRRARRMCLGREAVVLRRGFWCGRRPGVAEAGRERSELTINIDTSRSSSRDRFFPSSTTNTSSSTSPISSITFLIMLSFISRVEPLADLCSLSLVPSQIPSTLTTFSSSPGSSPSSDGSWPSSPCVSVRLRHQETSLEPP